MMSFQQSFQLGNIGRQILGIHGTIFNQVNRLDISGQVTQQTQACFSKSQAFFASSPSNTG
jgi:hypothetical protein